MNGRNTQNPVEEHRKLENGKYHFRIFVDNHEILSLFYGILQGSYANIWFKRKKKIGLSCEGIKEIKGLNRLSKIHINIFLQIIIRFFIEIEEIIFKIRWHIYMKLGYRR